MSNGEELALCIDLEVKPFVFRWLWMGGKPRKCGLSESSDQEQQQVDRGLPMIADPLALSQACGIGNTKELNTDTLRVGFCQ